MATEELKMHIDYMSASVASLKTFSEAPAQDRSYLFFRKTVDRVNEPEGQGSLPLNVPGFFQ